VQQVELAKERAHLGDGADSAFWHNDDSKVLARGGPSRDDVGEQAHDVRKRQAARLHVLGDEHRIGVRLQAHLESHVAGRAAHQTRKVCVFFCTL
jgi:hypothetical protein